MTDFFTSPSGPLVHPWLNTPDTKYNDDGLYHTDLDASGPDAEACAAKIEAASLAYLAEYTQEMTPGEAKKWKPYLPFERLEDDEGNPTGVIRFSFKQNAKIPVTRNGVKTIKDIKIELRDAKNQVIEVAVWDGSEGRVMFSMRGIAVASTKLAGVRLDLAKVQIIKLKQGSGGNSMGFGVVEGGYEADQESASFGSRPQGGGEDDTGGDY